MEKENDNLLNVGDNLLTIGFSDSGWVIVRPLIFLWKPKEDITIFELAQCLPYIINENTSVYNDSDLKESYFRHFEIINPNNGKVRT